MSMGTTAPTTTPAGAHPPTTTPAAIPTLTLTRTKALTPLRATTPTATPTSTASFPEILAIVEAADMSERAKATARRVFQVLAEAEAAAHGVAVDEVHFHEVGAVDSIVDVVAAAVCLDDLDVTDVVVPVLCEGQGTVRCQHGVIPVPVPAVVNVVAAHGIPLRILDVQGELRHADGGRPGGGRAHALPAARALRGRTRGRGCRQARLRHSRRPARPRRPRRYRIDEKVSFYFIALL